MHILKSLSLLLLLGSAHAVGPTTFSIESLLEKGHFKQAKVAAENRLKTNSKDVDAMVALARADLAFNNIDDAKKLLEQACLLQPGNLGAHLYLADAYSRNSDALGWFEKLRVAKLVKKETERALEISPSNLSALEGMLDFYLEAPSLAGGSESKAEEMAAKIESLDKITGALARAKIAIYRKDFDRAEQIYAKAAEANPKSYEISIELATLFMGTQKQNLEKAESWALKATQSDVARIGSYSILAQVYSATQKWDSLERVLANSEKNVPDDYTPYYIAGRTLINSGKDVSRAEVFFRKYLTQTPEGGAPPAAGAHWRLGQTLEKQGKKQEAIHEFEIAVQMKPDLKEAQRDLKRLKS
jgi:tetratricopeptide (TPR) repeat protein